jgi:hypothetical protein
MKFVLLHEGKNDDGIRQFFMDVWELYVKVCRVICLNGRALTWTDAHEPVPQRAQCDPKQCV